jgi:hypothetical protein
MAIVWEDREHWGGHVTIGITDDLGDGSGEMADEL